MLRTLIAFLHVISFSIIFSTDVSELKKDEFKAELTSPASIEKGSEGIVEINFTVGSVKGFAKLTENLPSGVIAEAVEMGDATFTFSNGILKIIWLNFPTDKTFSIKYKLKVAESAPTSFDIGGKFSYLENNEKRSYSVFKKSIATGGEALATQTAPIKEEIKEAAFAEVIRTVDPLGNDKYNVTLDITKKGIEGFCKIQEFTSFGGKMTEGDLNGAIFSFIKNKGKFVWMALPPDENFKVSYTLDLGSAKDKDISILKGDFSFLEGNVTKKVTIVNKGEEALADNSSPEKSDIEQEENSETETIKTEKTPEQVPEIKPKPAPTAPIKVENNEIALLEDNKAEESNTDNSEELTNEPEEIVPEEENSNEETIAEAVVEEAQEEIITETPTPIEAEKEEDIEETPVLENIEPESDNTEQIEEVEKAIDPEEAVEEEEIVPETNEALEVEKPEPVLKNDFGIQTGVNYRVQIAAGKNVVDKAYFEKRHNWTNDFVIENHNGWVKYTTGSYQVYRDARDNRETVNGGEHKFDGPFVTAYNEGIRITVQEALMISKQKWFK